MPDGDGPEPFILLEQLGDVVGYGLINAPYVPLVDGDPHQRRGEGLGHRERRVYGCPVVAVGVPPVEQLVVVNHQERSRPALVEVILEATIDLCIGDGLDLGGVGVVRRQLVEAGGGRCVVDGAGGEPLGVSVVGLPPEDGARQVEVRRKQIPNNDNDEREHKEQSRSYCQHLESSPSLHSCSLSLANSSARSPLITAVPYHSTSSKWWMQRTWEAVERAISSSSIVTVGQYAAKI